MRTIAIKRSVCSLLLSASAVFALEPTTKQAHGDKPASSYPSDAPRPIILDKFTADPEVRIFGDTYYLYPTSDKENWLTTQFDVWSSKDLITWKNEGKILDLAGGDVSWANICAWAPGVISRDGKYYMYFCGDHKIGVGVSDKPTGPFKDALDRPFIEAGNPASLKGQQIDPSPFYDEQTNQAYLYWGNGNLYVRKLAKDMISFEGELHKITPAIKKDGFREGIFVFKRNNTYYFTWSENDARSVDYRVSYGTSDSPLGPIQVAENRVILSKSGSVVGTGHHSVVNVPGTDRWYIVYHRHAIPGGSGYIRETCLSPLLFNSDGSIQPVNVNQSAFPPDSKGEPITTNKPDR